MRGILYPPIKLADSFILDRRTELPRSHGLSDSPQWNLVFDARSEARRSSLA